MSIPDRDKFVLETTVDSYPPVDKSFVYALWDDEDGYTSIPDDPLIFSVPKPLNATELSLRWPDGDFAVDEALIQTLTRPPTDFVTELSAPKSVTRGYEASVTLTVENTGSVAGTFVGALNRVGPNVAYTPVTGISLEIAAGESETWTHSYAPSPHSTDDDPAATFHLNWRGGRQSKIIDVEPV